MKDFTVTSLVVICSLLLLLGCGPGKDTAKKDSAPNAHGHSHDHDAEGPHGGELQEVGNNHEAHLEIKFDHAAGKAALYILDEHLKPLPLAEIPEVNVMTQDGPVKIDVQALDSNDGKAWKYEIRHEALKTEPVNGQVRLKIDGKTYSLKLDPHFK